MDESEDDNVADLDFAAGGWRRRAGSASDAPVSRAASIDKVLPPSVGKDESPDRFKAKSAFASSLYNVLSE